MAISIRVIVGIIGCAFCMLLYTAPILTFKRVTKEASVGEFSCVPYVLTLFSCLTYTWYGFPVVSCGWENVTVFVISAIGVLFETSFISIYLWFAPREKKCIFDSHNLWRDHVHLNLYNPHPPHAQVISWKYWCARCHVNVQLSACSCETCSQDIKCGVHAFVLVIVFLLNKFNLSGIWNPRIPNAVGCLTGILQLVVYCIYRRCKEAPKILVDTEHANEIEVATGRDDRNGHKMSLKHQQLCSR